MLERTLYSVYLSSAEVASSITINKGFLISARARATLCFCPPESRDPFDPTNLSQF
jgi:hypothetical protein